MSDEEQLPEEEEVERTVSTEDIKSALGNAANLGYPLTGQIKREGDTFEDEELGKEWDASFDSTKKLLETIENGGSDKKDDIKDNAYPYGEFDATKWAAEFQRVFPDNGVDEETMVGWFANAIMTGFDKAHQDHQEWLDSTE